MAQKLDIDLLVDADSSIAAACAKIGAAVELKADPSTSSVQCLAQDGTVLGVVPEHRSGRLFRDLLGTVNQAFGAACDEVHLVVAGRVLRL